MVDVPESWRLLVGIPCLNEGATLGAVIAGLQREIPGVSQVDVLVIDDGSTDDTSEVARRAGAHVIRHPVNRGYGVAFQTAVTYALRNNYDALVNIDGDGQFNGADLPLLVEPVLAGQADFATGSRFLPESILIGMPGGKKWGNRRMSSLISRLVGTRYADVSCGFRCYGREALLRMNLHGKFSFSQETFLDLAANRLAIVEVPVEVTYFPDRESRIAGSLLKYAYNAVKIITRGYRDYFPLRFFWGIALVLGLAASVFAAIFFGHFLVSGRFSDYLFAGFSAAFLFGVALAFAIVGLVADMLVRLRVNQERTLYLLREGLLTEAPSGPLA
jgi:glycosyltransferase involved in cell wall biosynthesis